jgi:hypothetical protein
MIWYRSGQRMEIQPAQIGEETRPFSFIGRRRSRSNCRRQQSRGTASVDRTTTTVERIDIHAGR